MTATPSSRNGRPPAISQLFSEWAARLRAIWRCATQAHALQREAAAQAPYQAILDAIDVGIVLYDVHDQLVLTNAKFRELYRELQDLLVPGARFESLLRAAVDRGLVAQAQGDSEAWIAQRLAEHRQPGPPLHRQVADGRWRRIVEQRLPDGSLLAFSTDITELVQSRVEVEAARHAAEQARQRLQDAIDALPDGFALYDRDDRLVEFNEPYRQIYAQTGDALVAGRTFEELLRDGLRRGQYPDAVGREEAWLARRMEQHRNPREPLVQQLPDNRWLRINERKTREGGYAGVRTDITELVRREQQLKRLGDERNRYAEQLQQLNVQLERLSATDALTGLANRRAFERRLDEEYRRMQRQGFALSLLVIDVDHFKQYNDALGHPAGDACLQAVAQALESSASRTTDLVARHGGEEFVILLPHTGAREAALMAARCVAAIDAARLPHPDSPVAPNVTISVGVATLPAGSAQSPAELLSQADQALYLAKAAGRHRYEQAPG